MTKKFTKMHVFFYETATTMTVDLHNRCVENWLYVESVSIDYKTAFEKEKTVIGAEVW